MKIKQDSWHYKWIAKRWDVKPKALCWYFWKLILSIVLFTGMSVILAIGGTFLLVGLTIPFWQWFFPEFSDALASFLSFLMWLSIGGFFSYQYRQYLYDFGRLTRKIRVPTEPGIVSQYIHTKHRKVCPLLKYEGY